MMENPGYWRDYYSGTPAELATLRTYSYSDRIRYYWTNPAIAAATEQLISNLNARALPETLVSQSFMGLEFGSIASAPTDLIEGHIQRCVARYFQAAGH